MTVFAFNDGNAAGVATFSVEPVCLADTGGQALVGKYPKFAAQGDVDDFVHGHAPGCFPNAHRSGWASVKRSALKRKRCSKVRRSLLRIQMPGPAG